MDKEQFLIILKDDLKILIKEVVDKVVPVELPRFIPEAEAKKLLNCSKTQMYYYRVRGVISYVQDDEHRKLILYDRLSIMKYLESNLKRAF